MGGTERGAEMLKSIASRIPGAGVMLLVALSAITLSMAACEDDAQSVRQSDESAAASTATAEPPTPSAEIQITELEDGDCINSTLPEGISIETVVIVPCSGDWQYRVTNSFQVADAEAYPDESFFLSQFSENCDRQASHYLFPLAEGWELGDRKVTCLQQAPEPTPTPEPTATAEPTPTTAATASTPTPGPTPTPEPSATAGPVADVSLSAAEVYARVAPSIVFIETPSGTGSGVLIDGGYIVTNQHVVWPYESVWVTFPDGAWYEGVPVIGWDALSDLAVLGPVDTSVAPAELADGEGLAPGSELYLIGYPAETEDFPEATISRGILSRFREWESFGMTYLQTDASIAGGQSGGALVNSLGQVVGISTFRFSEAGFGLATSIADDIMIIDDLIMWGWDSAEPSRRGIPTGEGDFEYTVTLSDSWTDLTFVLRGEAGLELQVQLDGAGDGTFAIMGPGGLIVEVDEGVSGTEYVELELDVDGLHFITVGMFSELPQSFELLSNVPLIYFADPDDEETIQVWEALTGNIDQHLDSDTFLLPLEEGESVAVFVESLSIDTVVSMGLPGFPETIAFDDDGLGGVFGTDSVLFYRAFQAGTYSILVSDATGESVGGYLVGVVAIDALEIWDDNGDGEITCDEATANSIAPASFTHPAYEYMDDGDSDGVVCD